MGGFSNFDQVGFWVSVSICFGTLLCSVANRTSKLRSDYSPCGFLSQQRQVQSSHCRALLYMLLMSLKGFPSRIRCSTVIMVFALEEIDVRSSLFRCIHYRTSIAVQGSMARILNSGELCTHIIAPGQYFSPGFGSDDRANKCPLPSNFRSNSAELLANLSAS